MLFRSIDSTGSIVIPFTYDDLSYFSPESLVAMRKKNKWGYINLENKTIIPAKYDFANNYSDGLAVVRIAKYWGAIDATGNLIIPAKWEFLSSFKNGVAFVKSEGKCGLMSRSSTLLLDCLYDKYQWETDKVIRFDRDGHYGYYNILKKEWIWKEDGF